MSVKAYDLEIHTHDVLVVGAGGAGLRAAIAAADSDLSIAVLSKVPPTRSHTVAAQGGINAALGNRDSDDWRWHMYDTIRGSDWLGDQDAIAFMCKAAPDAVRELADWGVPFTRDEKNEIYQRPYGGQTRDFGKGGPAQRACAAEDRTGLAIMTTMFAQAQKLPIDFFVEYIALDLIMDDENTCHGVLAWELATGKLHLFKAQHTILATGGYGQVYGATTASSICTGDGNAMCLRAGLALQDMEFIQFHPTGLYGAGILITEGARGEGGTLHNASGERFMAAHAPDSMELASRDVVSRAIVQELQAGRGCGPNKDYVELRIDHLPDETIDSKLPYICSIIETFANLNPKQDAIPVIPSVHYTMGGIPANLHSDVVGTQGLSAIGEAACNSTHGANRLGCNSLLDLIVFGKDAGERAKSSLKHGADKPVPQASLDKAIAHFDALRFAKGKQPVRPFKKALQATMITHAPIYRDGTLMQQGEQKLQDIWRTIQTDMGLSDSSLIWNNDLVEAIETDNLLRQAMVTMHAANARKESRGAHYRSDYTERDDTNFLHHSLTSLSDNGTLHYDTRIVRMDTAMPDTKSVPLEVRGY